MRIIPVAAFVFAATFINSSAHACKDDRYACDPKTAKPVATSQPAPAPKARPAQTASGVKSQVISQVARRAEEKAPPDRPRRLPTSSSVQSWQPIDVPSPGIQIEPNDEAAIEPVEIVSADDINEIDLAALPPPEPVKVRVIPLGEKPQAAPEIRMPSPPRAPADTSLLERVMVTFGGAFGAASAMRIFFG